MTTNFPRLADCISNHAKIGAIATAIETGKYSALLAGATGVRTAEQLGQRLDNLTAPAKVRIAAALVAAVRLDAGAAGVPRPALVKAGTPLATRIAALTPALDDAARNAQIRRGFGLALWFMYGDPAQEPTQAALDSMGAGVAKDLSAAAWVAAGKAGAEGQAKADSRKAAAAAPRGARTPDTKAAAPVADKAGGAGASVKADSESGDDYAKGWDECAAEARKVVLAALADMSTSTGNRSLSRSQLAAAIGESAKALMAKIESLSE